MLWHHGIDYPLDEISVTLNAPEESGVYAIRSRATWVYVGESDNIHAHSSYPRGHDEGPSRERAMRASPRLSAR